MQRILLPALLVVSFGGQAGVNVWTAIGPEKAYVWALCVDPATATTVYVATQAGGVFKSIDRGDSWTQAAGLEGQSGLSGGTIGGLAVDPGAPATVYGASSRGVFRSTDAGASWALIGSSPTSMETLLIDAASTIYVGGFGGMFRSTDGGTTWPRSTSGMEGASVRAIVPDPAHSGALYAGTTLGVFSSMDGAASWTKKSSGLPSTSVDSLAVDPRAPATIYAVTPRGLYKTTNGGDAWTALAALPGSPYVNTVRVEASSSAVFVATSKGVYGSSDGGSTWNVSGLTTNVSRLALDPSGPGILYAGGSSGSGLFRSTDAGATWTAAVKGLTNSIVNDLAGDPTPDGLLYAVESERFSKSLAAGGTGWADITPPPATNIPIDVGSPASIAVSPSSPQTLYAGTCCGSAPTRKSTDGGGHWQVLAYPAPYSVGRLAIDPRSPATAYAGDQAGTVYKTTDGGATWVKKTTGFEASPTYPPFLLVDPVSPATLYAANPRGVFKSTNGGDAWSHADTGIPGSGAWRLSLDPKNPGVLYAVAGSQVYKTTDGGGSWRSATSGNLLVESVQCVAVDPGGPSEVFAGTSGGGIYRSTDAGTTWRAFNTGLKNFSVTSLLVRGTNVYAATYGGGVFALSRSTSATAVWVLPSSARASGSGGAFYTTDLTVAETTGAAPANVTLKFLGNNADGRGGAEKAYHLEAGRSTTYRDVLGSVFGLSSGFGALQVTSASAGLVVVGQTSTPSAGGTFGQSVPAAGSADAITAGAPCSILGVREDDSFRTNLILANLTESSVDVDVSLLSGEAASLGAKRVTLPPLGMTQVTRVVRDLGVTSNLSGGRLLLATPTPGGRFAAYASAIDNITNDPRTLLPACAAMAGPTDLLLPSSARAPGSGGAFYTTDLTLANVGSADAAFTLKFLGHDADGRTGAEQTFALAAGRQVTYADVLGSVFALESGYGAIRIRATQGALAGLAQTWTPGSGGTFGQSVPVVVPGDLVAIGASRSIPAIREDQAFRTNLILVNATESPLDVDVAAIAGSSETLAAKRYTLSPLGMRQVTRVLRDLGVTAEVDGARLVLSTPTAGGRFGAYASVIDNVTNDPRTLLPR